MTYNWNTMVDITVPTGTNGWLYSGEVIINGIKVRFPVGVPTSVPEPAAALLNKMIELKKEEADNTAKPQNHYIGAVTIPEGKTLTLAKGAKLVDENNAPVVILPETEMTPAEEGMFGIMTPLSATPTDGATAKIIYNGVEYTSPIILGEDEGLVMYGMGNTDMMGLPGGNADAPFAVVLIPSGMDGAYGMVVPMDGATSVTLSIVQTEGAASGGSSAGALVVTAVISGDTTATLTVDSVSATHASMYAAITSGRDVLCIATHPRVTNPSGATDTTILRPVRATDEVIVLSCKTAMNSGFEIILQIAANGEYVAVMSS